MSSAEYYSEYLQSELASIENELAAQGVVNKDMARIKRLEFELSSAKSELARTKAELVRIKLDWKKQYEDINAIISFNLGDIKQSTIETFMKILNQKPPQ